MGKTTAGALGSYREISEDEYRAFADRMKAFRKRWGLTQSQLAVMIGIKRETLSRIEQLFQVPYPRTMLRFATIEDRYLQAEELEMEELEGLS